MNGTLSRFAVVAAILFSGFTLLPAASAAELIVNGQFDTNVEGWSPFGLTTVWDSMDADGSGASGSLKASTTATGSLGLIIYQCVTVQAGQQYTAGGSIFVPSTMPGNASVGIHVGWHSEDQACGVNTWIGYNVIGGTFRDDGPTDVWIPVEAELTAPAGAVRADVYLYMSPNSSSGTSEAFYDKVHFETSGGVRGDFNADGKADLLWRNYDGGAVNVWYLNGTVYAGGASLFTVSDPNWRIEGTGDFNGDGNTDLIWRHYGTGAVNVWFLNGTAYLGGASLFTVADLNWKIQAVGDFNGDGKDDLIWRNYGTGAVNVWFLDGTAYTGGANLFTVADGNWLIEAVGDFNGDGKNDLIWRHYGSGAVNVWYLNGTTYLGGASLFTVAGASWNIEATGDYNGDGKLDLIWRNYGTGAVNVWFLNGTTYLSGASLFTVAGENWEIAGPR